MSLIHNAAATLGNGLARYTEGDKVKAEIYSYVFERLLNIFIFLILLSAFAHVFGLKLLSFVFLLTFLPLRSRFGGAHAKSDYLCLAISVLVTLAAAYNSTIVNFSYMTIAIIYILAFTVAFKVEVVDNPNKRLHAHEKAKFKREGIALLVLICIINFTILAYGSVQISNAMGWAVIAGLGNLFLGD